jgi:hypothetical protein
MEKANSQRGQKSTANYRLFTILTVLTLALVGALIGLKNDTAEASTPPSGTIAPTAGATATWTGDKTGVPPAANGEPSCSDGTVNSTNCDTYTLTVAPGDWAQKQIRITITPATPADDYDLVVRRETNNTAGMQGDGVAANVNNLDATAATSGAAAGSAEVVVLDPPNSGAIYYIRTVYFAANPVTQYSGLAEVITSAETLPSGLCTLPTYDNYQPPVGYPQRDNSGEPSVGVNWNTGNVMSMSRLRGNRTTFDDSTSPASPTTGTSWFSNTSPAIRTGLDPILFTDSVTGRTIGGELSGNFTNGFISDDDISTLTASFQAATSVSSVDHQTIGGGPPNRNFTNPVVATRQPRTNYPHLFYYAAQNIGYADVATSFDGGLTYDKAVPAYTLAQCNGLHGHIKVAPDGTVYLPNKNCGGKAAVVVSEDNGLTWSVRKIPSSSAGDNDPSVGIGAGGRIFVGYTASDKRPRVAVSDDRGLTWRDDFNLALGVSPNLTASVFPAAVGGDNNRAAMFFLATNSTQPGDPTGTDGEDTAAGNTSDDFKGTWYPYIATTCDGGKSWSVVRADNDPLYRDAQGNPLPNPVQQGVVCTNGTTCPAGTRNLLDFNDITVDSRGRAVAVYADGCNKEHPCISVPENTGTRTSNEGKARLTIIRQRGGVRLFGAFDQGGPAAPQLSPPVEIESSRRGNTVKWATPDDNGSPLTAYRIYRGRVGQGEQLIAEVSADRHVFNDLLRKRGSLDNVYYHVTAVNAYGESRRAAKTFAATKGE